MKSSKNFTHSIVVTIHGMHELSMISVNNSNIMILFIQAIQSQTAHLRYLIVDDVLIRKPYGRSISPTSYVYDHANNRYVSGMQIVVLLWPNSWLKVPVAFRIWITE